MQERRRKRSSNRDEAISYLLGSVALAQGGRGLALIDDRGRLLAGAGSPRQMWAAARVAQGRKGLEGEGYVSRRIHSAEGSVTLAAFGVAGDQTGMGRAAEGVARILAG